MEIPRLTDEDIERTLLRAGTSERHRYAMVLHKPGDELNRIVNFLMTDMEERDFSFTATLNVSVYQILAKPSVV